jgi:glycosyltransferase involved in cell wall biosynthesis
MSTDSPLVSIVVPTYNRGYILSETIGSVLSQTYQHWELILVDDGSADNTKEIVERIGDERIKYHYQENQGVISARNNALKLAKGEWIAYIDSDNTFYPNYLEVMVREVLKYGNVMFALPKGNQYLELYQKGKLVKRIEITDKEFKRTITPQDIVHRTFHPDMNGFFHSRKVIEDGITFDKHVKSMEDWDLILTLCERYPDNFLFIDQILYTYAQRFGGDGLVSNRTYRLTAEVFEYIYQKHKNDKLMAGQTWYPDRVDKWNRIAEEYEQGKAPPMQYHYFKEYWKGDINSV